ncbi:hypothetical protein [Cycloclasticus pugetii]|uniref:hypothetical protein n=1 Tax=Cycloclasticus pugetii TaxID=34068 RepID=UPI002409D82C|nr:hypothetical protein [Cycloclasticus pugetii]MDF1830636.1 hypothetical protein [Cycloclasticus pugetii]
MIKDIPTSEEFDSAAKAQFDFAWDIVISFLLTLEEAKGYSEVDEDDEKAFWETARQRILTSLIIAQQGVELAIKGKLVAISPYLLISGNHSDWPKDNDGTGISFSEFRAIDAQDLVKVHDTVHEEKLDSGFSVLFERLRKLRNKAMHTVDKELNVSAEDVVLILLDVHEYLYANENWVATRRDFLNNSAATHVFFDTDHVEGLVAKEFLTVFNFLKPAETTRFFKIDRKQRLYLCPECKYESEKYDSIEPKYAVLRPNESDSEYLFCFVCDSLHPVERKDCSQDECPGNVISVEYDVCCTCGKNHG